PRVGPRIRLGEPEGGQLATGCEVGQPLAFLLLGAEEENRHRPQRRMRRDGDRDRRVDAGQLLDGDRVRDGVGAGAAVLLGDRDAHEAELPELRDEVVGEPAFAIELLRHRSDAIPCERPDGVSDQLVLWSEVEVHGRRAWYRAIVSMAL